MENFFTQRFLGSTFFPFAVAGRLALRTCFFGLAMALAILAMAAAYNESPQPRLGIGYGATGDCMWTFLGSFPSFPKKNSSRSSALDPEKP